jgi:hypothetical protein
MKEKELRRLSLPVHDICVIGKRRELDPERVPRLRSRSSGLGFSTQSLCALPTSRCRTRLANAQRCV